MASNHTREDRDSAFSFGVRELQQAQASARPTAPRRVPAPQWETALQAEKPGRDDRGSDPYNTSGSFDRSRNWARIGKR